MAIKATYQKAGLTIPEAYIRVESIVGSKRDGWTGGFRAYVSNDESQWFDEFRIDGVGYVPDENPYVTVYSAVKSKYPDAMDV